MWYKSVGLNATVCYKSRFTIHDALINKLNKTITMQQLVYMTNTRFKGSIIYRNTVSTQMFSLLHSEWA
jgi:hypothetical protein